MFIEIMAFNTVLLMSIMNYFYNINEEEVSLGHELKSNRLMIISLLFIANLFYFFFYETLSLVGVYALLIMFTLIVISIVDIRTRLISDNVNIYLFVVGIFHVLDIYTLDVGLNNVIFSLTVLGFFTLLRFSTTIIFNKEIIGEGDFILIAMFILLFGVKLGIVLFLLSFVLTIPFFIYKAIRHDEMSLPFIPFLSLPIVLGLLWQEYFYNLIIVWG